MEVSSLTTRVISQEALLLSRPGFSHSVVDSDLQINCMHIASTASFLEVEKGILFHYPSSVVDSSSAIRKNADGPWRQVILHIL
uniref:Uncharacterized protein n=1 Tax=Solanum lycopersicum TaxID=4081 RepID=A0A3Q7HAU9_SOLLC